MNSEKICTPTDDQWKQLGREVGAKLNAGVSTMIHIAPGNGDQYDILVTPATTISHIGFGNAAHRLNDFEYIISLPYTCSACRLGSLSRISTDYIAEKMNISRRDASVIVRLLKSIASAMSQ